VAGTVLRLPLRTAAQAARGSALVPTATGTHESRAMLEMFAANAHRVLLFAASLCDIKAWAYPRPLYNST
jgi:sacsin